MAELSTPSIIIRSYQPSDSSACKILLADAHNEYGNPVEFLTQAFETDMANIEKSYLEISDAHWWVAVSTDDNRLVGQVGIQPLRLGNPSSYERASVDERDQICELRRMAIRPDDQKRGIGFLLLSTLLDFARQHNYRYVHLSTLRSMRKACRFYEKYGFLKGQIHRYSVVEIFREVQEHKKKLFIDYFPTPVVFESDSMMPEEDQHRMELPMMESKFIYTQHFSRTL